MRGGGHDGWLIRGFLRFLWLTPRGGRQSAHCHQGCSMEQRNCCTERPEPGPVGVSASPLPSALSWDKDPGHALSRRQEGSAHLSYLLSLYLLSQPARRSLL